ncbi:hypothetical protein B7P43_G15271 [Cryptotermes secundus]|uniref:Endonuclease/exonuclease/phosphatase domain-containing protein n=1 Tax=Cryptotermes secundus TaxID=105785 RepID=A0A2J7PBI3_9NEOP|nr:hypothetical protein B7P43_G15271 [Cryptotermes secundus]
MAVIELLGYKIIVIRIYRSPDGNFKEFLRKRELVIKKLSMKGKQLILCGDWNVNNSNYTKPSVVMNLGFSDHYAQVLSIRTENSVRRPIKVMRRMFNEGGMEELQYILNRELRQDVFLGCDVNGKFKVFMDTFHYYFDMIFPLKLFNQSKQQKKGWVTLGIRKSSKRMSWLNSLQKRTNLTGKEWEYIHKYRMIYKRIIKEAKKRENDRHIANAKNKTRAMWQIVNKELGNNMQRELGIELKCGTRKEANPQCIAEMFNLYFADIVGKLVKQNNSTCNETMFICPVTENEILEVVKKFRRKFSAGTDEIPDYVVKNVYKVWQ